MTRLKKSPAEWPGILALSCLVLAGCATVGTSSPVVAPTSLLTVTVVAPTVLATQSAQPSPTVAAPTTAISPTVTRVATITVTIETASPSATTQATVEPVQTVQPTAAAEPTEAAEPTTTPTRIEAAPPVADQPAPTISAATGQVTIAGLKFSPAPLKVSVGTTVTWTNQDESQHTVTSGLPGSPDGVFNTELNPKGQFTFTFVTAGEFNYYCMIHPFMTGSVIVTAQ